MGDAARDHDIYNGENLVKNVTRLLDAYLQKHDTCTCIYAYGSVNPITHPRAKIPGTEIEDFLPASRKETGYDTIVLMHRKISPEEKNELDIELTYICKRIRAKKLTAMI